MTQPEDNPYLEKIRQSAYNSGYFRLLDMHLEEARDGVGATHIDVDNRLMHAQKIVHGGVIFTLADTAMSMALLSVLPEGSRVSTIEAKINYLLPVRGGELTSEATIVHRGNRTAVVEATVYNVNGEERKAIARVLGTFNIQHPKIS